MERTKFFIVLVAVVLLGNFAADGQTAEGKKTPRQIIGGVVNGKATSLPKPVYPDAARKAGAVGEVRVKVLIDEAGKVASAETVGGVENIALRQAAEAAALLATFSPTRLSGEPVKVSGVIVYNFVAVKSNEEKLKTLGFSTFLTVIRALVDDPGKLRKSFEGEDYIKEFADEFPELAAEFKDLDSFEKLPIEKRNEALTKAGNLIRGGASEADTWQFDVGHHLGNVIAPMFMLMAKDADPSELSKLDEPTLKLHLARLKDLTISPPPDFPKDVLEKLRDFAALADSEALFSGDNLDDFGKKIVALIETIAPDEN